MEAATATFVTSYSYGQKREREGGEATLSLSLTDHSLTLHLPDREGGRETKKGGPRSVRCPHSASLTSSFGRMEDGNWHVRTHEGEEGQCNGGICKSYGPRRTTYLFFTVMCILFSNFKFCPINIIAYCILSGPLCTCKNGEVQVGRGRTEESTESPKAVGEGRRKTDKSTFSTVSNKRSPSLLGCGHSCRLSAAAEAPSKYTTLQLGNPPPFPPSPTLADHRQNMLRIEDWRMVVR